MKLLIVFYLAILSVVYGLNKTKLFDQLQEYTNKYLILKNTQKYCGAKELVEAKDQDNLLNLSQILNICESTKGCDFLSFSPKRQLRNSLHYENEEFLKGTGANWICKGDEWINARTRKNWIFAVKEENIRRQMNSYSIRLNTNGECETQHIISKFYTMISPKEAAEKCNKMVECEYLIFNYNRKIGTVNEKEATLILCSATPLNRTSQLGYFIAGKHEDKNFSSKRIPKKNIDINTTRGAITPDSYYKSYNKGDVVHIENI